MAGYTLYDIKAPQADMLQEVIEGFSATQKYIHPKYFYDKQGSRLFEAITQLPEYYLTRTELDILTTCQEEIADAIGQDIFLIEFGSGAFTKVRILLENLKPKAYMPIDISKEHLVAAAKIMAEDYPRLDIRAVCLDYSQDFELPWVSEGAKRVVFFPGSSLGNFNPDEAEPFLRRVKHLVGATGGLLIGIDRKKPAHILHAAYDDASGTTSAFNLNVLEHINRALGSNFSTDNFRHKVVYNEEQVRIEMYLRSTKDQSVQIDGHLVHFQKDEQIATENSYKYHTDAFLRMAQNAGFGNARHWTDEKDYFSVFYLTA